MTEFTYTIKDDLGLHARPAGLFATKCAYFKSKVSLTFGDKTVDCKKLIRLLTLGLKKGDTFTVSVEGEDEKTAASELEKFFAENL